MHRHIKLICTYRTILTEHLLNADVKISDFQAARKSPYNRAGKEKREKGIGMGPEPLGGSHDGETVPGRSLTGREASREEGVLPRSDPVGRMGVGCLGRTVGAGVWRSLPGEHGKGCQRGRTLLLGGAGPS